MSVCEADHSARQIFFINRQWKYGIWPLEAVLCWAKCKTNPVSFWTKAVPFSRFQDAGMFQVSSANKMMKLWSCYLNGIQSGNNVPGMYLSALLALKNNYKDLLFIQLWGCVKHELFCSVAPDLKRSLEISIFNKWWCCCSLLAFTTESDMHEAKMLLPIAAASPPSAKTALNTRFKISPNERLRVFETHKFHKKSNAARKTILAECGGGEHRQGLLILTIGHWSDSRQYFYHWHKLRTTSSLQSIVPTSGKSAALSQRLDRWTPVFMDPISVQSNICRLGALPHFITSLKSI